MDRAFNAVRNDVFVRRESGARTYNDGMRSIRRRDKGTWKQQSTQSTESNAENERLQILEGDVGRQRKEWMYVGDPVTVSRDDDARGAVPIGQGGNKTLLNRASNGKDSR